MPIKQRFPYFSQTGNKELVYLDSAATAHKPECVIRALTNFYSGNYATVHRSTYEQANNTTSLYEEAREKIARFINAQSKNDIVWTKGTTESINLAVYAWAKNFIRENDTILITGSEHHANFVPWQQLAIEKNAKLEIVRLLENGMPDMSHYEELLTCSPKVVAMQHCSNVLGNVLPIKTMIEKAKQHGAKVLIDGAQAISHISVDVEELGCDLYAFSGHKMYGPTGIGVLYINENIKSEFSPFHFGGEMVKTVTNQASTFQQIPSMLESGTPNIAGVIGLSAAIDFIASDEYKQAELENETLWRYLVTEITKIPDVKTYGDLNNNIGILSFNIKGESASDVATLLGQQNIAVRTGLHCAMPLHQYLNTGGAVRVSLGVYNDKADIDAFIKALINSIQLLDI
jgi:SufS family cysteine desulfurase